MVGPLPEGCYLQGEVGQSKMSHFTCLEDAKKDFEKKFRDKTKNNWAERDHFVIHPGKYTLIEVQGEAEAQESVVKVKMPGKVGGAQSEGRSWLERPS
jgi:poly [ADP-ribose] polymerase